MGNILESLVSINADCVCMSEKSCPSCFFTTINMILIFHERRCTPLPCLNLNWQQLKNGKFRDKLCCITFVTRSTALTNLDLFFGGKIDWSCWQQTSFSLPCWSHLSKLTKRILFQNYSRCPIIDQNRRSVIKISISKMTIYQISLHLQRRIQDFPEGGANPKRGC